MNATPAKLRNGSWGARVVGSASVGDTVRVRTRAGAVWTATVTGVVWSGRGVTLVSTRRHNEGRGVNATTHRTVLASDGRTWVRRPVRRRSSRCSHCGAWTNGRRCTGYDCA